MEGVYGSDIDEVNGVMNESADECDVEDNIERVEEINGSEEDHSNFDEDMEETLYGEETTDTEVRQEAECDMEERYRVDGMSEIGRIDFFNLTADEVMNYHFCDVEVAIQFYAAYAKIKGFGVRRSKEVKNKGGEVVQKTVVCSNAGFRLEKFLNMEDRKRKPKKETRCGCNAQFRVHLIIGVNRWYITYFSDIHSHELLSQLYASLLPNHRKMHESDIMQMNSLRDIGISTQHIYESFVKMSGGPENVGFIKRDVQNQIEKQRRSQSSDAQSALAYLCDLHGGDVGLFWRHTVDSVGRLENLFWCDGTSRSDYEIFGEVVAFDATYRRNKYMCPFIVFSGVNHHNQTIIFACALVANETEETYMWVLEQFLLAMQGNAPVSVITDGDIAMRNSIKRVFPNSYHRLCAWHLLRNATAHVGIPAFTTRLKECMFGDFEVGEFEFCWNEIIEKFHLQAHRWVNELYEKKKMWATAYMRGKFFAGFRTTSRCEGLNAQLGRYVHSRNNITEFLKHVNRCLSAMRFREIQADFDSVRGTPVCQTSLKFLEKSAAKVYTLAVFKKVRDVLGLVGSTTVVDVNETPSLCIFKLQKYGNIDKVWHVSVHLPTLEMTCSCKKFESKGIPCEHMLSVAVYLQVEEFPKTLVLKRWTKSAKDMVHRKKKADLGCDTESIFMTRYASMVHYCKIMCNLACRYEEDYNDLLEKIMNETTILQSRRNVAGTSNENEMSQNIGIMLRDPAAAQFKGCGSNYGSRGRSKKRPMRCGICKEEGHNRKSCQVAKRMCEMQNGYVGSSAGYDDAVSGEDNNDWSGFFETYEDSSDHVTSDDDES